MAKLTLAQLGSTVRAKRGENTIRETAEEIGVAAATLSRIERGHTPDLVTFGKLCEWLGIDPAEILGVDTAVKQEGTRRTATAHFRTPREIDPELAGALAELILATQQMLDE